MRSGDDDDDDDDVKMKGESCVVDYGLVYPGVA